ncbi:MAG: hypothetical protein D8M57_16625 [Candidatus Scalindua sp. AMX11]|nr:MAG: hypothetical protein DWQ00_06640 [Candidatus Scalindua sp.]NOG84256.1 hypothetical protein [Planctomycetota bacterium]RZV68289.1 MAG: hypothetical protein EX341_16595 [Candidatus Scalindua sp. SCAELEC01]TDE63764.1 MAG: hypothetical protein D8M57_16625 [Candidatus Scalindua sp. AMX11]GJQ60720.1 MAG: hypothetical protein SCALA701_35210 [Candidatus Scalindua sp.]
MKVILIRFLVLVVLLAWIPACKTYRPIPIEEVPFLQRSQTDTIGGVTVTAAVLSPEESEKIFGRPLAEKGIQPVWLEIKNGEKIPYFLVSRSLDPTYFSASEAAYMNRVSDKEADEQMANDYRKASIDQRIPAGKTNSGFVFTRFDLGTKVVPVVMFGPKQVRSLVFYIPVPGLQADYDRVNFDELYQEDELVIFDKEEEFRDMLTRFQCCTRNEDDTKDGDPLNIVLVGNRETVFGKLARAGWDETEAITFSTALKTAKAFFSGDMYKHAPISPQYLFGRVQDIALQKGRDSLNERNHTRLWLSPWVFLGKPVWIGQISRDIGIRFSSGVWNLTTHAVDPVVDDARDYLAMDLMSVQGLAKIGPVKGVGAATPENPREILLGDLYWTDGNRLVMVVTDEPVLMDEIDFFNWDFRMEGVNELLEKMERDAPPKSVE